MRVVLLLATALCASCSSAKPPVTFSDEALGFSVTYPASWVDVKTLPLSADRMDPEVAALGVSVEDLQQVFADATFAIIRPGTAGGKSANPNILMLAEPVSEADCAAVNAPDFAQTEYDDYAASLPAATPAPASHLAVPGTSGYAINITVGDRTFLQHKYFYCRDAHYVVIVATASTPDSQAEIRTILSSLRITR